ncbi:unnamed protein product [Microthlaspi erraticum]|uniref:Uncharacterized protein n=1 Tax=Microthlaspi erraticum TaxID=1685480 RepID=A0A6D2I8C9_9BRAS|nr:unnamed protein product [Microthlaspi erraticum]
MVEREEEKITSFDKTGEEDSEGGIGDGNAKEVPEEEKREAEGEETACLEAVHQVSAEEPVASSDVGAVGEYTEAKKLPEKVTENVEDEGDEAMKTPEKEKADVDLSNAEPFTYVGGQASGNSTLPQKGEEKRVPQLSQRVNEREYIGDPRVWGLFASRTEPRYEPINRAVYRVTKDEFKIFQRALKENTKKCVRNA